MTQYICSRYYRPPEALCESAHCVFALDMWSVGCVYAEMISNGGVIFFGNNTQDVLRSIVKLLGAPPAGFFFGVPSEKCRAFLERTAREFAKRGSAGGPDFDWEYCNPGDTADVAKNAVQFLRKLLKWDPEERLSVAEALKDPLLATLHCEAEEPVWKPEAAAARGS
eukprot:g13745.t1